MIRPTVNAAAVHIDSLQQCLCPRLAALAKPKNVNSQPRRGQRLRQLHTSSICIQQQTQSQPGSKPPPFQVSVLGNDGIAVKNYGTPDSNGSRNTRFHIGSRFRSNNQQFRDRPRSSVETVQQMGVYPEDDHGNAQEGQPPVTGPSNPVYVKMMRRMLDLLNSGNTADVFNHAKFMASKGYAPTVQAYTYLINACAKTQNGWMLQDIAFKLVQEMKDEGFRPSAIVYLYLLRILAHSPDYLALQRVLVDMKEYWMEPDNEGAQYIIQSLLATGQPERALEMFDERRNRGEKIEYNTYLEIIRALGRIGEVEEALYIMQAMIKDYGSIDIRNIRHIVWYELLDIAASNYHLAGTSYVWRKAVQYPDGPLLNPDDGLCLKVLNTAARHGSPELAMEVFRVLALHKLPYSEHHYAALIAARARALDLPTAFRTLNLMRERGVLPTVHTANVITETLIANNKIEDVDSAYFILKDFKERGETIDITAFNAVVAACIKLKDYERALGVYSDCASLDVKPTTETFNILFQGCVDSMVRDQNSPRYNVPEQKNLAMFLAGEMKEMGLLPDLLTYEELLKVSLYQADYEDAFLYLEEMKDVAGGRVRPTVYEWIAERLLAVGDERFAMVVEEMQEMGYTDYAEVWRNKAASGNRDNDAVSNEHETAAEQQQETPPKQGQETEGDPWYMQQGSTQ